MMNIINKFINYYIKKNNYILINKEEYSSFLYQFNWLMEHSDINSLKPATGYLRKRQKDLETFANDFFNIIKEINIHPFLICGNLIGVFRNNGFIPWDDDLDFGLMREEYRLLIEYCKKHMITNVYNGKISEYNEELHVKRMNELVKKHPNEYILDIWIDQIQIMKGSSDIDRLTIDFWPYDYYVDDYSIEEHKKYLKSIEQKKIEIDYADKIIDFLSNEIKNNANISETETNIIAPGIDNVLGYIKINNYKDWIKRDDLFPLKKSKFENSMFYCPNNVQKWIQNDYPDYEKYPSDFGISHHLFSHQKQIEVIFDKCELLLNNLEFVDIYMELYNLFEKNGVYSYFVFDSNSPIKEEIVKREARIKMEKDYSAKYVISDINDEIEKYKTGLLFFVNGNTITNIKIKNKYYVYNDDTRKEIINYINNIPKNNQNY